MIRVGLPRSVGDRRPPVRSRAWASQTTVLPSIASLESASASVFSTRHPGELDLPAGGPMPRTTSGLQGEPAHVLVLDLPPAAHLLDDELESSRASIEAPGARAAAARARRSDRCTSATLLLAIPRGAGPAGEDGTGLAGRGPGRHTRRLRGCRATRRPPDDQAAVCRPCSQPGLGGAHEDAAALRSAAPSGAAVANRLTSTGLSSSWQPPQRRGPQLRCSRRRRHRRGSLS